MIRHPFRNTLVLSLLLVLLAACGGSGNPAAPTVAESTAAPTSAPTSANTGAAASDALSGLRTFVIVPEQSTASYLVDEEFFGGAFDKYGIAAGESDVVGSTQAIAGQLQLNLDDLAAALGDNTFTVQMNTLTTDQRLRDGWIRENGPRFNDYPAATFQATALEGAPAAYTEGEEVSFKLIGDLTVREISKPVTFDVTASLSGDTLSGVATTQALMSDFGIEPPSFANTLTVADAFAIEVEFTAKEQVQ